MVLYLPSQVDYFPHPFLSDEQGFLAIGEDISSDKILLAYQFGIFPWYNEGDPIFWWSTHPRFVLFPEKLKIQKSMRTYLNQDKFDWTIDTAFSEVITNCSSVKRDGQSGTWISDELKRVFIELHEKGYAHSVEVWENGNLVGGLYGLALGKIFFGESMFAKKSNASKFGFIKLVNWLKDKGFELIDCQQETNHLESLGAELISEQNFFTLLKENIFNTSMIGKWKN